MTRLLLTAIALAGTALTATAAHAQSSVGAPKGVTLTPFTFATIASRSPDFDRSAFTYPTGDLAGQVNPNVGDVRLDGISANGITYDQDDLRFVTAANILVDDAVDVTRGGHNLTAGRGIGADLDSWINEGAATTTPSPDDLVSAHANFNLTSIAPTREGAGTAIFELAFAEPTDTLFLFERGGPGSGDVLVSALDDAGNVLGSFKVRDGLNDGGAATNYTRTGITVTTYVQEGFLNQGQELGTVGLRLSEPAKNFRFTVYQEEEAEGAVRFNGPDLKVLGLAANTQQASLH